MVNEALLVLIWAADAAAIVVVVWLLANERRRGQREDQSPSESDQARDPDSRESGAHQIGAQASCSHARMSGSTSGPISASTRA